MKSKIVIGALLGLLGVGAACLGVAVERPPEQRRAAAQKAFNAGNFNDAYKGFASLATGDADDLFNTPQDFDLAVQCLQRLARWDEVDDFREKTVAAHPKNWRLLQAAARSRHIALAF